MARAKRRFIKNVCNHVYQNTIGGAVLFYSELDYLSFFTRFCVCARKYDVSVVGLTLMFDHIHHNTKAFYPSELSDFVKDYTCHYSREQNELCHRKGALFNSTFGSAPKKDDKSVRTNLVYMGNNPVERCLCKKAEQYKWNFLAYAKCDYPFSEPIQYNKASRPMKKAIRIVRSFLKKQRPLNYHTLKKLFSPLRGPERAQLTDYIISQYNVIDYDEAIRYFGNYERMIESMHVNTGSEYDIKETFVGTSDICYPKMIQWVEQNLSVKDVHDIFLMDNKERKDLFYRLQKETGASGRQVAKFLRLNTPG